MTTLLRVLSTLGQLLAASAGFEAKRREPMKPPPETTRIVERRATE